MIELYILLLIMIIASIAALEVNDLLSSVVVIGAVGLCLSVGFLLLKAPDLAITQLIVEIVLVTILLRATLTQDQHCFKNKRDFYKLFLVILLISLFLSAAYVVINDLPIFGKPLMRASETYLMQELKNKKVTNLVCLINLKYMILDTFGAMVTLFSCVISVILLSRKNPEEDDF
ncbi:MAG: hydrogenase subunit MbhD domain-containing protein [Candidatus Omnitrophota bacterium]